MASTPSANSIPEQPALAGLFLVTGMAAMTLVTCLFAVGTILALPRSEAVVPGYLALASAVSVFTLSRAWHGRRWAIVVTGIVMGIGGSLISLAIVGVIVLVLRDGDRPDILLTGVLMVMALGTSVITWSFVVALVKWDRIVRHLERRHLGRVECMACGYDLRGNPEAAACPECGAARSGESASAVPSRNRTCDSDDPTTS